MEFLIHTINFAFENIYLKKVKLILCPRSSTEDNFHIKARVSPDAKMSFHIL